jgi:sugar lactone lactonase YvrE
MAAVSTIAGRGHNAGFLDGLGAAALFHSPCGIAVDGVGTVFVVDRAKNRIRKITPEGLVSTFAGSGEAGKTDGQGISASFNQPSGIAVGSDGVIFVADTRNHCIRKISPEGLVTTFAGSSVAGYADGQGIAARFNCLYGIAVDSDGMVYVADTKNHRIRKISPDGRVTTIAGSGGRGFADGRGTTSVFQHPTGIAVGRDGVVYVADYLNHRIRKITPEGLVSTLAGSRGGFADGKGDVAQFNYPIGVHLDGDGNLTVADYVNHRIRMVTPDGTTSTIAGSGTAGFLDENGAASQLHSPWGVAVNGDGNLIIADCGNCVIRVVATELTPPAHLFSLPPVASAPSAFACEMAAMLDDPALADVAFVVEGVRITAHRAILVARCEYFKRMFLGSFREGAAGGSGDGGSVQMREVVIGETSPEAFHALLRYVYTDQLEFDDSLILSVMRKAHEISLDRVYDHCLRHCCRNISVHNALIWFVQAHEFGLDVQRAAALNYIGRNLRQIREQAPQTFAAVEGHPEFVSGSSGLDWLAAKAVFGKKEEC